MIEKYPKVVNFDDQTNKKQARGYKKVHKYIKST